jgi:hypothetical protein
MPCSRFLSSTPALYRLAFKLYSKDGKPEVEVLEFRNGGSYLVEREWVEGTTFKDRHSGKMVGPFAFPAGRRELHRSHPVVYWPRRVVALPPTRHHPQRATQRSNSVRSELFAGLNRPLRGRDISGRRRRRSRPGYDDEPPPAWRPKTGFLLARIIDHVL